MPRHVRWNPNITGYEQVETTAAPQVVPQQQQTTRLPPMDVNTWFTQYTTQQPAGENLAVPPAGPPAQEVNPDQQRDIAAVEREAILERLREVHRVAPQIRRVVPPPNFLGRNNGENVPNIQSDIVGKMLGKEKTKFLNKPSTHLILPDTHLGIEIEVEGVNRRSLAQQAPAIVQHYFDWHDDNSLHDNGQEFTYKSPMFGEDVTESLRSICKFGNEQNWRISTRCGIHVHMDARDLTRHQLLGLLVYYVIFEPAIFAWVGNDRHANNFCVPWFKYEGSLHDAINILDYMRLSATSGGVSPRDIIQLCERYHKYAALNLKALATYGSIEFRHLQTTLDYDQILIWVNILLGIKRAAMDVPESTMTIINEINRFGIDEIARRIFGEPVWQIMLEREPDLMQEIKEYSLPNGIEFIQAIVDKPNRTVNRQKLDWPTTKEEITEEEKKDHAGFSAWRKANFPKEKQSNKEEPPPQQGPVTLQFELDLSDTVLHLNRPRSIPHITERETPSAVMVDRGYMYEPVSNLWLYRGLNFDNVKARLRRREEAARVELDDNDGIGGY